jgi:maltose alpha-D-glucosyltransferase/alpha-amylase
MGEDLSLRERNSVRTPMQWSSDPQGGFSRSSRTIHPVISGGLYGFERVNVESQRRDPDSLLSFTARMIRLRKECPEIGWGSFRVLATRSPAVLALRYDWQGSSLVILHNFDEKPHEARIRPAVEGGETLVNLLVEEESRAGSGGAHRIALPPYGYRWYRVGRLHPRPDTAILDQG